MRDYREFDRDHIWSFFSGGDRFVGNPKYLFIYINKYRPDIYAYWVTRKTETMRQIRVLGLPVCSPTDDGSQELLNRTGVRIDEQVQEFLPEGMEEVKYINLWHGRQGFNKPMETHISAGILLFPVARKYIRDAVFFHNHQYFPLTGYPRNLYQRFYAPVSTYPHDILREKGLPASTKIVLYASTYRASGEAVFGRAFPDLEALHACCKRNGVLLIFKMHAIVEREKEFLHARRVYGNCPHFLFWDNENDIYEILHQVDLLIMDYSSIVCDAVAMGIPHYLHYIFDYEEYTENGNISGNYEEYAVGRVVRTFDELLDAIDTYTERDDAPAIARKKAEWWEGYVEEDVFETIISMTFDFRPGQEHIGNLYSFSVFGTLVSRDGSAGDGFYPLSMGIDIVRRLCETGHSVVLIEDTEMPAEKMRALLADIDPVLTDLPLFLSGEQGVTKASGELFIKVYQSFGGQYRFDNWVHVDSDMGSAAAAKKLNIRARRVMSYGERKKLTDLSADHVNADFRSLRLNEKTDARFAERCREKLERLFPDAKGKTVIFYAPSWRLRGSCRQWLRILDLKLLRKELGDGYAVVVHIDPAEIRGFAVNPLNIRGFSRRIRSRMTERELFAACDIMVGDYRRIFCEAVLDGHKPVFA
ncbi:MAG: CDP-glycerol glycerophosphotransferase family protein, partial [Lachnospiraceae bacterium]|nr:CDP-glycerol glycerophosphotransferase family protein [Lachnospiraceae bacterium]